MWSMILTGGFYYDDPKLWYLHTRFDGIISHMNNVGSKPMVSVYLSLYFLMLISFAHIHSNWKYYTQVHSRLEDLVDIVLSL